MPIRTKNDPLAALFEDAAKSSAASLRRPGEADFGAALAGLLASISPQVKMTNDAPGSALVSSDAAAPDSATAGLTRSPRPQGISAAPSDSAFAALAEARYGGLFPSGDRAGQASAGQQSGIQLLADGTAALGQSTPAGLQLEDSLILSATPDGSADGANRRLTGPLPESAQHELQVKSAGAGQLAPQAAEPETAAAITTHGHVDRQSGVPAVAGSAPQGKAETRRTIDSSAPSTPNSVSSTRAEVKQAPADQERASLIAASQPVQLSTQRAREPADRPPQPAHNHIQQTVQGSSTILVAESASGAAGHVRQPVAVNRVDAPAAASIRQRTEPDPARVAVLKVELETGSSVQASVREHGGLVDLRMSVNDSQTAQYLNGQLTALRRSLDASAIKLQRAEISYSGERSGQQPDAEGGGGRPLPRESRGGPIFDLGEVDS